LGDTDLELTVIGLGTWAIGGGDWAMGCGPQDEKDSVKAILEALEKGINWIDSAAAYGFGHSEEAVGKATKEWGKPIIIATKFGVLPAEKGQVVRHVSRETILKEVDASLKRLQVGCIDLYQIR
jgi:aryl-alcohol dehydrogenase-like predicted oxidoreductase